MAHRLRPPQVVLLAATMILGLAADVQVELPGQLLIGAAFWAALFHVLRGMAARERQAVVACLAIATAAEIVLSLGWGLYTYRLSNIPMFVPPGHAILFLLGTSLARRMPAAAANAIAGLAAAYAIAAAVIGLDTLGLPFLLMFLAAWFARPAERRLIASTLLLALGLELYGTALGTWTWLRDVPYTSMVTTNPPLLSSALYSTLDALVAFASALLARSASLTAAAPATNVIGCPGKIPS